MKATCVLVTVLAVLSLSVPGMLRADDGDDLLFIVPVISAMISGMPCDGERIGRACWWFGGNGESCDEVCDGKGGYLDATRTYAGSGGSDLHCGAVMEAIDPLHASGDPVTAVPELNENMTVGCGSDYMEEATTYRVFGRHTDGPSSLEYFRRACACGEQPPPGPFHYGEEIFVFDACELITPMVPSDTNYVDEFVVEPGLPKGLTLDPATGMISGTPGQAQSAEVYEVTASNAGGSNTFRFSIEVVLNAPSGLSYPGDPFIFTVGTTVNPVEMPEVTGCVQSFAIEPALGSGLIFSTATGGIWGTPTLAQESTKYSVSATNDAGHDETLIFIEIVEPPLACDGDVLGGACWWFGGNGESCDEVCDGKGGYVDATRTYAGSDGSDTNCGSVMTTIDPFHAPGDTVTPVSSFGGSGTLGCGSDYTGVATTYRVHGGATNATAQVGNFRRACACNEQPAPASLSYTGSPFTFGTCEPITPLTPSVINYVREFLVEPALPGGLSLDTATGVISGTPATENSATVYWITAQNAGGSDSFDINIEVVEYAPSHLDYPGAPFVFTVGVAVNPAQAPTVEGCVDSWSISPPLGNGLIFDTSTGEISGTPSTDQSATPYTVRATNGTGYDEILVSITINPPAPCDGVVVGGHCWYWGRIFEDDNCDEVCATHGGCNDATLTYAGSEGTDANCGAVMTALGAPNPTPVTPWPGSYSGVSGLGCGSDFSDVATTIRVLSSTTSSAGLMHFRRACACDH